jgi:AcrR family transcriptional regulator
VNILSAGQQELCAQFARKGGDKFDGVTWQPAPSGAPVIDGVMAWIDCELTQTFESGDHFIAIGRVLQLEAADFGTAPLVFFQGGFQQLGVPPAAVDDEPRTFAGVTYEELARQTGTDVEALLRYANSTEGLVDEIVGGYVRTFHGECAEIAGRATSSYDAVGELLERAFGSMEQNRVAIMILQNERPYLSERPEFAYLEPLEHDIESIWHDTLRRGVDAGEFRPDLDVALAYRFIRDVLFTAARWFSSGSWTAEDASRRAEAYRSLILHGLSR